MLALATTAGAQTFDEYFEDKKPTCWATHKSMYLIAKVDGSSTYTHSPRSFRNG